MRALFFTVSAEAYLVEGETHFIFLIHRLKQLAASAK